MQDSFFEAGWTKGISCRNLVVWGVKTPFVFDDPRRYNDDSGP
jgi:hypothetical protein